MAQRLSVFASFNKAYSYTAMTVQISQDLSLDVKQCLILSQSLTIYVSDFRYVSGLLFPRSLPPEFGKDPGRLQHSAMLHCRDVDGYTCIISLTPSIIN